MPVQDAQNQLVGCLFKYGPLEDVKKILKEETLGFNALEDYNDIYETEYKINHYFHSLDDQKKLFTENPNPIERIFKLAKDYLDSLKVTCFSRSCTNTLMWAHYAENHGGVCYCYDSHSSEPLFLDDDMIMGDVVYSSHVPEIKVYQDQTTEGMLSSLLSDVVLTKSQEWAYEKEVRFYRQQTKRFTKFNPSKLKAIIVGRRVKNDPIDDIKEWLKEFNSRHNSTVKILFAHRYALSYRLGIHRQQSIRDDAEKNLTAAVPVIKNIKSTPLTTID